MIKHPDPQKLAEIPINYHADSGVVSLYAGELPDERQQITEADYQAAIPAGCYYQTVDEHVECLMLCWGLMAALKEGRKMNCGSCEMNVRGKGESDESV